METTTVKTLSKYSDTELLETTVVTSYNIVSLDFKKQKLEEKANIIAEVLAQKEILKDEVAQAESFGLKTQSEVDKERIAKEAEQEALKASLDGVVK